ncbi:MAG TPA: type III-B CRISPR module RAMP protein Cmr6 [Accumulibacter sp.]|nr:type III-B CRISPR module RAMP protein Cmr6 [Accumulibacter sp.]
MIALCRRDLQALLEHARQEAHKDASRRQPHAGLLLQRGLPACQGAPATADPPPVSPEPAADGEIKAGHLRAVASLRCSDYYRSAFRRWQAATADGERFNAFDASLAGRLYIGVSRDNALETGVSVAHSYGMPLIPGSAVKGLCRASAGEWLAQREAIRWLFGETTPQAADPDSPDTPGGERGGLIFHDAWWIPDDLPPFVAEVITVHHPQYYASQGKTPASDFDAPVPAPQLAVRGAFRFVIEGPPLWTALARRLLVAGLQQRGIGSKRSSGYGFFNGGTKSSA